MTVRRRPGRPNGNGSGGSPPGPTIAADWHTLAPPLDPPNAGGVPVSLAETFADDWWEDDPFYALGLMWDAYCGMLGPPSSGISHVNTGAQSVTYSPPMMGGEAGSACARAQWYFSRSFNGAGGLASLPLRRSHEEGELDWEDWEWWFDP